MMNPSRRTFICNLRTQPEIIRAIVDNNLSVINRLLHSDLGSIANSIYDQNLRTPLHLAAALGRTEIIDLLLHYECYPANNRDLDRYTPLHRACRNDHVDAVRSLLKYNADVNVRSRLNITAMHICASSNSLECARLIRGQVTNINATDSFGVTALHYAVYNNNIEMVQFLIENGAKADMQDEYGQRPIHYAAAMDSHTLIGHLVKHGGADVNVRNKDLLTPLHFAVAFRNPNAFRVLLDFDANIEAQDIKGNKVAHWAALIGCGDIFEMILERTSVTSPNLNGITPLHFSCSSMNSFDVAVKLMQLTEDINVMDKFRRTPLHYAAMNGNERTAKELINRGADTNFCDVDLETPIHKATQNCHSSVIGLLNNNGAKINIANKDGFTALHLAVMAGLPMNCKTLIHAGASPLLWDSCGRTPHFLAIFKGSFDCFYHLMVSEVYQASMANAQSAYISLFPQLDAFKRSLLHYAAASNVCSHEFLEFLLLRHTPSSFTLLDPPLLEMLEENFRHFNINQMDIYGRTPLHYVCRRAMGVSSDIDYLIKMLVESGADCSILDETNRLPLHYAIANGYTSSLGYLMDQSWLKNRELMTRYFAQSCPLKIAAYYDKCSAINELVKYGFNNFQGAIEVAVRRFNWSCVDLLMSFANSYNLHDRTSFSKRERRFILKMALFSAYNGVKNGLRLFLKFIPNPSQLLLSAALSKIGFSCVELLIDQPINFNYRDKNGRNALFYAVVGGNIDTIKLLIEFGVRFVKDKQGNNMFHFVAQKGDVAVFNLLNTMSKTYQFYGYLCNYLLLKNNDGLCPIEIACLRGHQKILEYYVTNINKGFEEKLMYFSGLCANVQFIQYLVEKNGQEFLNFRGSYDRSLLHYCCMSKRNNNALLKMLLELNFDVNAFDEKGYTPLLCAALVGNWMTVQYLVENAAECNLTLTDSEGNTALHLACSSGSNRTPMVIIAHAKDRGLLEELMVAENNFKQTCLHLSAKNSLSTVIQELLINGASVTDEDAYGYTPTLYCTKDSLAAYCLLIMESYMEYDQINNDSLENGPLKSLSGKQVSASSLEKRRSWQSRMSSRFQRLSKRLSAEQNPLNGETKDSSGPCIDSIVDSDSELY